MYLERFSHLAQHARGSRKGRRASFPFLRRARGLAYAASADRHAILYVALASELAAMGLL
jgi:hypothetical protein